MIKHGAGAALPTESLIDRQYRQEELRPTANRNLGACPRVPLPCKQARARLFVPLQLPLSPMMFFSVGAELRYPTSDLVPHVKAHLLDSYSQFIGVTAFEEKQITDPEGY
jgi:hypothetical protein